MIFELSQVNDDICHVIFVVSLRVRDTALLLVPDGLARGLVRQVDVVVDH